MSQPLILRLLLTLALLLTQLGGLTPQSRLRVSPPWRPIRANLPSDI